MKGTYIAEDTADEETREKVLIPQYPGYHSWQNKAQGDAQGDVVPVKPHILWIFNTPKLNAKGLSARTDADT